MELIQFPQEGCDPLLAGRIVELEQTAWPGNGDIPLGICRVSLQTYRKSLSQ